MINYIIVHFDFAKMMQISHGQAVASASQRALSSYVSFCFLTVDCSQTALQITSQAEKEGTFVMLLRQFSPSHCADLCSLQILPKSQWLCQTKCIQRRNHPPGLVARLTPIPPISLGSKQIVNSSVDIMITLINKLFVFQKILLIRFALSVPVPYACLWDFTKALAL